MPQLDITTFSSQLFWLTITFVVLYLTLWRAVLPRIGSTLARRQRRIDDDLERAAKLRGQTKIALKAYEDQLAAARETARAGLREAAEAAAAEADRRQRALTERLDADLAAAEARIAAARTGAIAGLGDLAAGLAGDIASRLAGAPADAAVARRAVDAALAARAEAR